MRQVKKNYRSGARANPWGTLASRGKALERMLLIEIFLVQFLRYEEIQQITASGNLASIN
jgi:hypothetical protein